MISISPIASIDYYIRMETDAARARGIDDYYAHDEAGYFLGTGAKALGLEGPVTREDFEELAAGRTPLGDVQNAGAENRRIGWDLTMSAPKSASILWAAGNEKARADIQGAHDRAAARTVEFLERHASVTRRHSGEKFSDTERHEKVCLVAAVYRHGTSREKDPQLHTHVCVFNVAPRADGSVGSIDGREFYQWKMAAGAAYRAELASELKKLGYQVERDGTSFKVTGVPQQLCDEFSKRRSQIEAALKKHGATGAKASEVAALDTRRAKETVDRETLIQTWQATAREIAPNWKTEQCLNQVQRFAPAALDVKAAQEEMTRQHSTVSEAQLYASVGVERQIHGNIADIEKSVADVKADVETVALEGHRGEARFTTKEMQTLERQMVERAERMSKAQGHEVSAEKLQAALDAKPTLSQEQREAVMHITKGHSLAAVHGMAGTGKSFMLSAAKDAWEAEGYRVRGASLSGKAAQELQASSGIESTTIRRMEMDTRGYTDEQGQVHKPTDPLTGKDVVVVDEAGMSGSRQTAALLEDAERAGAKVVLVGDTRQLQAIDAGAAFRALSERTGSASLNDIQRQHSFADREAVRDLAAGRAEEALQNLSDRGRVHESDTGREAKEEMGKAIAEDLAQNKKSLGLTGTRREAQDVNEAARESAKEKGLVNGRDTAVSTSHGERHFAEGDRVIFNRNVNGGERAEEMGGTVKNGDLGTVKEITSRDGQAQMKVDLDRGGERQVDTQKYDHLDHGYATTVHKAQGSTVDRAHILGADNGMASREWGYVAGSRAREETHVHSDKATLNELAPNWSKARQKDVSLDYPSREKSAPQPEKQQVDKSQDRAQPGAQHERDAREKSAPEPQPEKQHEQQKQADPSRDHSAGREAGLERSMERTHGRR